MSSFRRPNALLLNGIRRKVSQNIINHYLRVRIYEQTMNGYANVCMYVNGREGNIVEKIFSRPAFVNCCRKKFCDSSFVLTVGLFGFWIVVVKMDKQSQINLFPIRPACTRVKTSIRTQYIYKYNIYIYSLSSRKKINKECAGGLISLCLRLKSSNI